MDVAQRLVYEAIPLLVIEHNLDVIRCSDWIIDPRPEGGHKGRRNLGCGTLEKVVEHPASHTGRYLDQVLGQHPPSL